jgi:hypothetical protein
MSVTVKLTDAQARALLEISKTGIESYEGLNVRQYGFTRTDWNRTLRAYQKLRDAIRLQTRALPEGER